MTLKEAVEVLRLHNAWRRNRDDDMQNPTDIGIAIDLVVNYLTPNDNH